MTSSEGTSLADRELLRALWRRHLHRFTQRMVVLLLLIAFPRAQVMAQTGLDDSGLVREYFVRQEAEQPLVIRVNPFEAEFRVRVTGPNGELLRQSELPGNRTQPLFLYVDGSTRARQLDILVEAPVFTRLTRFELEFYRLDIRDALSEQLARAYQLMSRGQEFLEADTAANWSVKINMLIQAARLFEEFGMEELRLWAWLAAAHLAHFELGDSSTALDWAGQVIEAARLSALPGPGFAGQVLQGEVLFQRADRSESDPSVRTAARTALETTHRLAGLVGNRYEQAWSLFLLGEELAGHGEHESALERYRRALEVAEERDATGLVAEIRKRMVAAHELLGDVVATEQTLGSMVEQLAGAGAETELVRGLLAQGQLYLELFRYPDAEAALRDALDIDTVSLTRTHATILLGRVLYEAGRFEEAVETLSAALVNPQTGTLRRPNPLLPLASGLEALAGAYRQQGLHSEAYRVRMALSRHLETSAQSARWARQRVLDELAAGRAEAAAALYRDSESRFRAEAGGVQGALALLALCAEPDADRTPCDRAAVDSALRRAEAAGPREMLDARLNRAGILALEGRTSEAASAFSALLVDVHFYRAELGGVLGAWFWEYRGKLFRGALNVMSGSSRSSSMESFAALSRILAIGRVVARYEGDDALRAEIQAAGPGWQESIRARRERFRKNTSRYSAVFIRDWLEKLAEGESVLALLPERNVVRAWLATRTGVRYRPLSAPPDLQALLAGLADNDTPGARERVGTVLLSELASDLTPTVYWLPVGRLLGADPGRFLLDDRRLGAERSVIGLLDFPSSQMPSASLAAGWEERVFLAGDPVDWSSEVPERLSVSREMDAVRARFAGPGLHMVHGNALLEDEFSDVRLGEASLVHLALPARIELARPEQSRLELSEPGRGAGRQVLSPEDARNWELRAGLVVLGQAAFESGEGPGDYDSRLGLVTDLVESGAGVVMACRPNRPEASAVFMQSFYQALEQSRDMAGALRKASSTGDLAPSCQLYSP